MSYPVLRLRDNNFAKVKLAVGVTSDAALAIALGVNRSTVIDVKAGRRQPSGQFLASLLHCSNMNFDELFELKRTRRPAA